MFRFTIRELVLVTVIVSLAVAWWINWAQLSKSLSETRRIAAERRASAAAWEAQATRLADHTRMVGWRVETTGATLQMVQWPSLAQYAQALEKLEDERELAEQIERSVKRAKEIERNSK